MPVCTRIHPFFSPFPSSLQSIPSLAAYCAFLRVSFFPFSPFSPRCALTGMKKEGSKRARNFLFCGRNNLGGSRLATDADTSASIFNLRPRNIPTKHFYHLQSQLFLSLAVQISPLYAPSVSLAAINFLIHFTYRQ